INICTLVLLKRFVKSGPATRPSRRAIISRLDFAIQAGGAAISACGVCAGLATTSENGKKYPATRQSQNGLPPTIRCMGLFARAFNQHVVVDRARNLRDDALALLEGLGAFLD